QTVFLKLKLANPAMLIFGPRTADSLSPETAAQPKAARKRAALEKFLPHAKRLAPGRGHGHGAAGGWRRRDRRFLFLRRAIGRLLQQAQRLAHLGFDLDRNVLVLFQERARVLPPLSDAL